ncbi:hypothetical protein [Clostridium sp. UBA5712]|uniref:hypothetical protein n=1 Tax=Clostridium sp. UBA5712 TaxID=1946368 RepID=UPI0032178E8B
MNQLEYELKDGRIITTPANFKLSGIEMLVPSIINLKDNNGDYTFKDMNGELKVKASEIASVKFIF